MKLLTCIAQRQCSRLYEVPKGFSKCGRFLQVFRNGLLQLNGEYYVLDHAVIGHVVWFPEDLEEWENVMVSGCVE